MVTPSSSASYAARRLLGAELAVDAVHLVRSALEPFESDSFASR